MAHPRRVAKVTSQMLRELGDMFCTDSAVMSAISPGSSSALSAVASISNVYVSSDLQVVKAYVSIYSDERGRVRAMQNLKKLEPYVRHEIGQRMRLRLTPEVHFEYDDSLEEEALVERVLGVEEVTRIKAELEAEERAAGRGAVEDDSDDDDDDEFEDDGEAEAEDEERSRHAGAKAAGGGKARSDGQTDANKEQASTSDGAPEDGSPTPAEAKAKRPKPRPVQKLRLPNEPGPFDDLFAWMPEQDGLGNFDAPVWTRTRKVQQLPPKRSPAASYPPPKAAGDASQGV